MVLSMAPGALPVIMGIPIGGGRLSGYSLHFP